MTPTSLTPDFSSFLSSSVHNMKTPMQQMMAAAAVTPSPLSLSNPEHMIPLSLLTAKHSALFQHNNNNNNTIIKTPPIKRKKIPRRKKWTKPKDKPKRPLSAYNLFFKDERELKAKLEPDRKLGFAEMGRMVAAKWKSIDKEKRAHYNEGAKKERDKYFEKLEVWKKKQETKKDEDDFDCQMEEFYDSFTAESDEQVAFGIDQDDQDDKSKDGKQVASSAIAFEDETTRDILACKLQMALDRSVELDPELGAGYLSDDFSTMSDCNMEDDEESPEQKEESPAAKSCKPPVKEEEPPIKIKEEEETPTHPCCSEYGCRDCPTMKRILKTFQVLEHTIDDEFLDFMSTLDWSKGSSSSSSSSSTSTRKVTFKEEV